MFFKKSNGAGGFIHEQAILNADGRLDGVNEAVTLYASAARTASSNGADQKNYRASGIIIIADVTAVPTVETLIFTLEGKDPLSLKYYTILASAASAAAGTTVLRVFPGAVAAANATANDRLPTDWRVRVTHSAAGSFTYSVGAHLLA